MSKKISIFISFFIATFFSLLLILPSLNPSYKKLPFINFFENIEKLMYDAKTLFRGPVIASDKIVIAAIDEESITKIGRWPWSRSYLADLTEKLIGHGAKIVVYDIVFSEKEKNHLDEFGEDLKTFAQKNLPNEQIKMKEFIDSKIIEKDSDYKFSQVIAKHKEKLIFSYMLLGNNMITEDLNKNDKYSGVDLSSALLLRQKKELDNKTPIYKTYNYVLQNIPQYTKSSLHEGFLNAESDTDSIYRKSNLIYQFKDKIYPSIALKIYSLYKQSEIVSVTTTKLDNFRVIDKISLISENYSKNIATDLVGSFHTNYRGPTYSYPHFGVSDILESTQKITGKLFNVSSGNVDDLSLDKSQAFKDKIVIIGATASLLSDIRPIPFNKRNYPGVEIHATAVDNLITGDYLHKSEDQALIQSLVMFLLALIIMFAVLKLKYMHSFVLLLGIFFTVAFVDYNYFFLSQRVVVDIMILYLQIFSVYASLVLYRYFVGEKDNRFLINTFKNYLSPELIDSMYESKKLPSLGGETKVITAFFSDVQGFSSFSEKLSAQDLVSWMNEYLTAMTDILVAEMGTLDKYEGDAIVAFFGAPIEYNDHAIRACRVALKMQIKIVEMREVWRKSSKKWPEAILNTRTRVGLNTGNILTGNIGSKQRMNYTMMGHAVNLAARLESSAKQYGIFIQISSLTRDEIKDHFLVRKIDKLRVVGITEPIQTYEVLDFIESKNKNLELLCKFFEKGLYYYNLKQWDEAEDNFNQSIDYEKYRLNFDPDQTNPSKLYLTRCKLFKKNPPAKDWDGVYVLESK